MTAIRVLAALTVALLLVYFVIRALASNCSGTACDAYIPLSLLIPLLVWIMACATGATAIVRAAGGWRIAIAVTTGVSLLGPIAALFALRDSPDTFVPVATLLVLSAPVTAAAFTFVRPTDQGSR